jgi:hypothetical protein
MSLGAQNVKTGPDTLGNTENVSGRAKRENGTRRTRHRRKRVWARKTGPDALGNDENLSGSAKRENGT